MSLILCIETATTMCSVALFSEENLLSSKELDAGYTHAENLHIFIRETILAAGIENSQIDAIALSKGPGSYTGLRIGASTAKGLAYALNIPLIAIDTLQIMAFAAREKHPDANLFCPMIDARRMEVYTAVFDDRLKQIETTSAFIVDGNSIQKFRGTAPICFFGDGMPKCKELLRTLENAVFAEKVIPSAGFMGALATQKFRRKEFEDLAYFEPFYLKEFVAGKKKSKPA